MKKKILSIILIGMMSSVALWGCGSAPAVEETDATTEEVSEETEEEPVEETEEALPQNMVTIYLPVRCFYGEPDGTEFAGKTEYDDHGNLIKSTDYFWDENTVDGMTEVEYEYDANGNIIKILSDGGSITTYEYMEMQIPDIKHYHKDNNLIIFGLRYISV